MSEISVLRSQLSRVTPDNCQGCFAAEAMGGVSAQAITDGKMTLDEAVEIQTGLDSTCQQSNNSEMSICIMSGQVLTRAAMYNQI